MPSGGGPPDPNPRFATGPGACRVSSELWPQKVRRPPPRDLFYAPEGRAVHSLVSSAPKRPRLLPGNREASPGQVRKDHDPKTGLVRSEEEVTECYGAEVFGEGDSRVLDLVRTLNLTSKTSQHKGAKFEKALAVLCGPSTLNPDVEDQPGCYGAQFAKGQTCMWALVLNFGRLTNDSMGAGSSGGRTAVLWDPR
ncbi:hypothetical protein AVEN_218625-1 [Araneus ventricosus]|uniref:Uncharacterized protein n=1 Tax=Araneus ventricosus TaxID=182803 RepID=A0A4Y2JU09_ARAVE|nr:hypothetical protein AVEN_218625-1 [Araneus ventricosus]